MLMTGSHPLMMGRHPYVALESGDDVWFATKGYKDVCSFVHSFDSSSYKII